MSAYRAEANALDAEILSAIHAWRVPDFDDLALRIFAHQLRYNEPYARFCASLGVTLEAMPGTWDAIPPVPAGAFKEAALCTFDPAKAVLTFETSGTTTGGSGKHYVEHAGLYRGSLLAGFREYFLRGARSRFRFLLLVPNPARSPHSSLGYMMKNVAKSYGDSKTGWYLDENSLRAGDFANDARDAIEENVPVIVAGTAFSLLALLDTLREHRLDSFALPPESRIMVTGGFKGRTRQVGHRELYRDLALAFEVPASLVIVEYGMTELCSQYYGAGEGSMRAPPWLRSYAVDENGMKLPPGVAGALVHVDLANRSSCVAIQTEDLGAVFEDGGLVLLGRDERAELRGCSLDAELLRAL